jgi:hypothetical protein
MYRYYGILLMLSFHLFDVKMSHANSILPWSIFLNLQTYYEWWSVYFFHEFHFCHVNGTLSQEKKGLSWSWSYGSWNYNHLWNRCLRSYKVVSLNLFHATLCDKVGQWLAVGWWFSPGTPVSSTNRTDCHDITEILLKVALNIINQPTKPKKRSLLVAAIMSCYSC